MDAPAEANRLIDEKSPYLLQHAHNPVDWYPWGEQAFARARAEDKAIFLSIGYSTCHWCHVMEHESFEDEEVAALLNEAFVCIKVDREERPDIDSVYMTVCQVVTGGGGWPLTIIMTPDKRPFFAATYLPKESRFGQLGLLELVPRISDYWRTQRQEALALAGKVVAALRETQPEGAPASRGAGRPGRPGNAAAPARELEGVLQQGYEALAARYDGNRGGFGRAPKFPTPHNLAFLLRWWRRSGDQHALEMVEKTLQAMRHGGVYDQIGFGLHRYSTDAKWLVPHFEKMLYDQALVSLAALEACQATKDEQYGQIARDTFEYVLRDLTAPSGGFYSAEDADSEGVEGKFYVWTEGEIREALPADLAGLAIRAWGVTPEGNYHDEATREATGSNILHLAGEPAERLEEARRRLLERREQRVRPGLDDKVLVDWNGLMVAGLARGAQVLGEARYEQAARRAVEFVFEHMLDSDGRLLHRYRDGEAAVPAYLDDYAFLAWGLLELYEATFDAEHLQRALALTEYLLEHFWDPDRGGFYLTSEAHEELLVRQKESYDGALPSGNSVALLNLLRLARMTGRADLEARAAEVAEAFASELQENPAAHTQMLCGLDFAVGPAAEVLLVGEGEGLPEMLQALGSHFIPNKVVMLRSEGLETLAPYVRQHEAVDNQATAYVCRQQACAPPVTEAEALLRLLQEH